MLGCSPTKVLWADVMDRMLTQFWEPA
jgi:hypothetical protein